MAKLILVVVIALFSADLILSQKGELSISANPEPEAVPACQHVQITRSYNAPELVLQKMETKITQRSKR